MQVTTHNGSVGTVRGIANGVLSLERRDGVIVRVDAREHPGIQHAYCSTEYREQGNTRYAELQLVTKHVNQRSLTVGMTRHTGEYGMYYAREEVGSYQSLVGLGLRTQSKELASDFGIISRSQERAVVREMDVKAITRELEPIAKGEVAAYSREERKAAFGLLNELGRLAPSDQLKVRENWHQELQEPKHLQSQIKQQHEQVAERARAQEMQRERGRGMGR